jgi:two-component system CheB/CheR fusion protein
MSSKPQKIFILDDNDIDREAWRRHLARKDPGYVFVEHDSVDGAVEKVLSENPDCILLDYHLHDGNGVEFLESLAKVGGPTKYPVVMLTGTGSESIAVQVMKAGAQDYLVKDRLNPDLLHKTVETAIYKARTARLLEEQRVEMERLFQEAQEANARKDQFLAALSHELRTPLTPVLAAITATNPTTTSPEQMEEVFAIIRRNIELEARLIDDMLDLTRISRGKLEVTPRSVDLHALLEHAAHACDGEREEKNITLEWHLDAQDAHIVADPARVQQVFWNLLKNAIKFTPKGGKVTVETCGNDGGIEVEVLDTGIGLPSGEPGRIFDAFEQGGSEITRRFGGLGLGLAISKALIDAHGGTICAANNPSGGARFTVRLPRGVRDGQKSHEPSPVAAVSNGKALGRTILVVEDHADSAFFIKRMLEIAGYRTLVAENIASAIEVFRDEPVDAIVSDLGLPDGRGTELIRQVLSIRPVPAIALSGYGMESDIKESLDAGFTRHLTKPVDMEKLEKALSSIMEVPA